MEALSSNSHSTLPGSAFSSRIQTSNIAGRDLPGRIEAAEDEAFLRAGRLRRALGRYSAIGAPRVIGLIAMRQDGRSSRCRKILIAERQDHRVADDIVQPRCADGAGIAQIIHLHRTGPMGKNAAGRAPSVWPFRSTAMSISRSRSRRATSASSSGADILEAIKRLDHPRAHRAAVIAAEGNGRHLELSCGHGFRSGRRSVRRWHADGNPTTDRRSGCGRADSARHSIAARRSARHLIGGESFAAGSPQGAIIAERQKGQRRDHARRFLTASITRDRMSSQRPKSQAPDTAPAMAPST